MDWKKELDKCSADPQYFYNNYFEPLNPFGGKPLIVREADFIIRCADELPDSDPGDFDAFTTHWTGRTQKGRMMEFEKKSTFDIKLRFGTWMRNKKKFATVKLANKIFGGPRG